MAGLFVALDVEYASDPKIIRAGAMAELVYVRALALAKRLLTDGRIDAAHLPQLALGLTGKPTRHADALVREGLWTVDGDGWVITAWARRNASRADVEARRQRKRDAAEKGNHERWHVNGNPSLDCRLCLAGGIANGSQVRSQPETGAMSTASPEPYTEPEPYPETTSGSSSSASSPVLCQVTEEEVAVVLERYADLQHQRTGGPKTNPKAWRATVIAQARADHRQQIIRWLDTFDVPPERIAAALVDGRAPADWTHHRKAPA